jgi:CheY-like chemotaxis protein
MKTLLLVDDDAAVLQCISSILIRFGYSVVTAGDGVSALAALSEGTEIDLAIVDYKLPGMDGLELVRTLKHRAPTLPVIVLTGNGSLESYCTAGSLGVDKYVLKPIKARELGQLVAGMLGVEMPDKPLSPAVDYDFVLKQLSTSKGHLTEDQRRRPPS